MSIAAPDLDTGPGNTVPTSATSISASTTTYLLGAHFTNKDSVSRTIFLTTTAGVEILTRVIPAGGEMPYEWPFRPLNGVKWRVSGGVLFTGHVWGYTTWPF